MSSAHVVKDVAQFHSVANENETCFPHLCFGHIHLVRTLNDTKTILSVVSKLQPGFLVPVHVIAAQQQVQVPGSKLRPAVCL